MASKTTLPITICVLCRYVISTGNYYNNSQFGQTCPASGGTGTGTGAGIGIGNGTGTGTNTGTAPAGRAPVAAKSNDCTNN